MPAAYKRHVRIERLRSQHHRIFRPSSICVDVARDLDRKRRPFGFGMPRGEEGPLVRRSETLCLFVHFEILWRVKALEADPGKAAQRSFDCRQRSSTPPATTQREGCARAGWLEAARGDLEGAWL
jgi:hypothetical protein